KIQNNQASKQEIEVFLEDWKILDEESTKIMDSGSNHVLHIVGNLRGIIRAAEDIISELGSCSTDVLYNASLGLNSLKTYIKLLKKYSTFKNKESESMDGMFPEFATEGRGATTYTAYALKKLEGR
ncbi:MAG: hypothetical protein HY226_01250, partial [Candidatus Vogelbacteria bacterium]|nr:hypothetical protein [Candidatus Vogelbacteria bacterium]